MPGAYLFVSIDLFFQRLLQHRWQGLPWFSETVIGLRTAVTAHSRQRILGRQQRDQRVIGREAVGVKLREPGAAARDLVELRRPVAPAEQRRVIGR